jgi:hypothetical protein
MGWGISILLVIACGLAAAFCTQLDKEKAAEKEFKKLLAELQHQGHDTAFQQAFVCTVKKPRFQCLSRRLSSEAYQLALANLAANLSKQSAKTFVQDVGRWHLARLRTSKRPSAADEQTIQSDILKRCSMLAPSYQRAASWTE